jgi:phage-related protein
MAGEVGNAYVNVVPRVEGSADAVGSEIGSKLSGGMKGTFGAGVVALGNMLSNALTSVASTVGEQVSKTFWNYADFEQLSGGVEKIFNEANIDGIMQDANNAYKELNMSVNEYLASINQTGAAFAQTMGDQKGYDTARTGMMAIADYASGTGRNLDELNEKYAMITRSTSSYQSIADQFSGILPATSKDFLEQAKAAGFLEESYTSLTDVPIDEYQQAVSKMLEKGVADMGLAGNTARESTETISGSLAMLNSAWENMLTGLMNGDANLDELVGNLGESIITAASVILPQIGGLISTVFTELPGVIASQLSTAAPAIAEAINGFFAQFGLFAGVTSDELTAPFAEIGEKLGSIFEDVQSILTQAFSAIMPVVLPVIQMLASVFANTAVTIVAALSQVTGFLAQDVMPTVTEVFGGMTPFIEDAVGFIGEFANEVVNTLGNAFELILDLAGDVWPDISSTISSTVQALSPIVRAVFNAIKNVITSVFNAVRSITSAVWPVVSNVIKVAVNAAKGVVSTATGAIKTAFNGLRGIVNTVRNIFNAVKNAITNPIETAKGLVRNGINAIKGIISGTHFQLPHINLPHFSVSGGSPPFGIGGQGSLPSFSVSWYARGGIVNDATLIGAGERGTEFIWPGYDPYMTRYARAIADNMPSSGITVNFTYNGEGDATEAVNLLTRNLRQLKATGAF